MIHFHGDLLEVTMRYDSVTLRYDSVTLGYDSVTLDKEKCAKGCLLSKPREPYRLFLNETLDE